MAEAGAGSAVPALRIVHLFTVPQHRQAVAALIHHEFWTSVPGATVDGMARRLEQAHNAEQLPLCLLALHGDELLGAVNLVHSDDDGHPEWTPWLAGMVVAPSRRGQGVGSALVHALVDEARRLGVARVYFGTDGPGFYTRLGAVLHEQVRADFCFMRFDLA
jgi:predicted N-acetyltransferase YhbS